MLDRIMALVALVALGGYLSIFVVRVREIDLLIVLAIVFAMAAFDFFGTLFLRRKK